MLYISLTVNIIFFILFLILTLKNRSSGIDQIIDNKLSKLESIEREVKELNSIFTLPYLRGEAGETLLKEMIKNSLPSDAYKFQYSFRSGLKVDAIVKTGKYIVPIDSKFPIQSVKDLLLSDKEISNSVIRTFLKHGEDISKKYIKPKEGTLNFAVMYIPSEKLFYKAFVDNGGELTNKMLKIGILPASPSTLFCFIQTVVYGLKGYTYNIKQNEILEQIETLKLYYSKLKKQFQISNNHLKNLRQSMSLCDLLLEEGDDIIPE